MPNSKQRERLEYNRQWRAANREHLKTLAREYREKNRERIRAYFAEWRAKNRAPRKPVLSAEEARRAAHEATARYRRSPKGVLARRRRELGALGITVEDYDAMLAKQRGVCALCGKPETKRRGDRVENLTVDHCHDTGIVRGLLCRSCNRGLGMLGDTRVALQRAVDYLSR